MNIPPRQSAPLEKTKKKEEQVEKQVQQLLKAGFIEPSSSPWGSPILFMKKKPLP